VSTQQSTIPTLSIADSNNHLEDNSLRRGIPSDLLCHVSKQCRTESPSLKPDTVSNLDQGPVPKFQMKPQTDLWHDDGASVSSAGSHRRKRASQFLVATNSPKKMSSKQNRKARLMKLQHSQSDAGTVETQPPEPDSNTSVASQITPTKWLPDSYMQRPPDSYMAHSDSELSSDNDSRWLAKGWPSS
jgi:hypothetical protein